MAKIQFDTWTGTRGFYFRSTCGRFQARTGNFGTMIVTDWKADAVHVVKGKMPEVVAFCDAKLREDAASKV